MTLTKIKKNRSRQTKADAAKERVKRERPRRPEIRDEMETREESPSKQEMTQGTIAAASRAALRIDEPRQKDSGEKKKLASSPTSPLPNMNLHLPGFNLGQKDALLNTSFEKLAKKAIKESGFYLVAQVTTRGESLPTYFDAANLYSLLFKNTNSNNYLTPLSRNISKGDIDLWYSTDLQSNFQRLRNLSDIYPDNFDLTGAFLCMLGLHDPHLEDQDRPEAVVATSVLFREGLGVNKNSSVADKLLLNLSSNDKKRGLDQLVGVAACWPTWRFLESILNQGADPNAVDEVDGYTPLALCVQHHSTIPMRLLLEHGADPHQPSADGSAWEVATEKGRKDVISLFDSFNKSLE